MLVRRPSRPLLLCAVALCAALAGAALFARDAQPSTGETAGPPRLEAVEGVIAVQLRPGATLGDLARIELVTGGSVSRGYARSRIARITLPAGVDTNAVLEALRRDGRVEAANREFATELMVAPNDPGYANQWNLKNTANGIRAEAAWDVAPNRGQGVRVAVLDTGIAYENCVCPNGRFERAPDLAATTFVAPWDFVSNDVHANDDNGHGTLMSGVLAQDTNNGWRYAGVAPRASIMPVKVVNHGGQGSGTDLVEGIRYAVDNGADVISMSLAFPVLNPPPAGQTGCEDIVGLTDALDYAFSQGVVVVAASGNSGLNHVYCPAAYPSVISVGATTVSGTVAQYSNGGDALDVTAPGGDSNTRIVQEGYCDTWVQMYYSEQYDEFCPVQEFGTSLSTPHVAGIAALILGERPALTPGDVAQAIRASARDRGPAGWDSGFGWGIVDAYGAVLAAAPPPTATPTSTPEPTATLPPQPTPTPSCADGDADGMTDCYEALHACLDSEANDAEADPDADLLVNTAELAAGTDPCARDSDGDGCGDGKELGPSALQGGQRDPLSPWDFYDVTSDRRIDSKDLAAVRVRFNPFGGGPDVARWDRTMLVNAWAPGPPDGKIDAIDTALSRASFMHIC
jgi:serine protease